MGEAHIIEAAYDLVPHLTPDVAGEVLRDLLFTAEGFGCYSNFNVRDGWRCIPPSSLGLSVRTALLGCFANCPEEVAQIEAYTSGPIIAAWHWDGDGTLVFAGADWLLENGDCKKSYGWERNAEWIAEVQSMPNYYETPTPPEPQP